LNGPFFFGVLKEAFFFFFFFTVGSSSKLMRSVSYSIHITWFFFGKWQFSSFLESQSLIIFSISQGSIDDDGLGPVSWWAGAEQTDEP
jgi:hypothetical protein